uniref:sialic acid-binding Ig-like lectin 12 n=1 Tax=Maylandia zebra TaxID=106582 RepID=UPI000D2FBF96|nr:sialic acid-binding Ig-like lectin 12 [Maylandia zebra]
MSLSAAASGLVLFLLSLTVVQSQNDYAVTYTSTQICAVKGSTVDIGCSFKHPSRVNVLKRVWFTKGNNYNPEDLKTDPAYAGRVSYSSHWKSCTLTIRDLRESDSAVYKFRFETDWKDFTGLPGVTLTVTDLQVKVSRIISVHESQTEAELKCESSCSPAGRLSFVWFKNNHFKVEQSSYQDLFSPGDIISCAFKGHEGYRSDPVF